MSALATAVCHLFWFEPPSGHNDIVTALWPGYTPNGPTPCCLSDHFLSPDSLTLERTENERSRNKNKAKNTVDVITLVLGFSCFYLEPKITKILPSNISIFFFFFLLWLSLNICGPDDSFPDHENGIVILEKLHVFDIHYFPLRVEMGRLCSQNVPNYATSKLQTLTEK